MLKLILAIVTIIGPLAGNVNAATAEKQTSQLDAFVTNLIEKGSDDKLGENIAPDLGLKGGLPYKWSGADPEEATDNLDRNSYAVLNDKLKPTDILFLTTKVDGKDSEAYWYRYKPNGKLELAIRNLSKVNEDGSGVRGSAKITKLKVSSADVKAKAQRELEFWLKGMHRTKLGTLRLTNPDATAADVEAALR